MLIFHYKHTRIPQGNITILWLNMFYAYFSLQTHKDTPGKHYNSLVKYVLLQTHKLIFHYKHKRIPQGNITILWLNMFYAYFHYKHKRIPQGNITFLFFQICLMLIFHYKQNGYPRETLQFFG